MSFDHNSFRALIFAAFIAQDWQAVADALLAIQMATGTPVLNGQPTPDKVRAWAAKGVQGLRALAKIIDETGDLPPDLQCQNPGCRVHGAAVRGRLAAQVKAHPAHPMLIMPSVPGIQ